MSRVGGICGGGGYIKTNFRIRIRIQSCIGICSTKCLCTNLANCRSWDKQAFVPIMKQLLENI